MRGLLENFLSIVLLTAALPTLVRHSATLAGAKEIARMALDVVQESASSVSLLFEMGPHDSPRGAEGFAHFCALTRDGKFR
jgi:hypothetical protein